LAVRQHALVCSGLDALKAGGVLAYSTCSISPLENDGVIDRLFKSREGQFKVRNLETGGEPTKHGRIFLPDQSGAGPLYTSILDKI
jgi:16S rRNA C967 or C1407 C5-methylase (RsmB/RsmF family)